MTTGDYSKEYAKGDRLVREKENHGIEECRSLWGGEICQRIDVAVKSLRDQKNGAIRLRKIRIGVLPVRGRAGGATAPCP